MVGYVLKILGAFVVVGLAGGLVLGGFAVSGVVYHKVADATFGTLGLLVAAPIALGPLWLIWKFFGGRVRDYDGRGFTDGGG
jgi:hypothetical protein